MTTNGAIDESRFKQPPTSGTHDKNKRQYTLERALVHIILPSPRNNITPLCHSSRLPRCFLLSELRSTTVEYFKLPQHHLRLYPGFLASPSPRACDVPTTRPQRMLQRQMSQRHTRTQQWCQCAFAWRHCRRARDVLCTMAEKCRYGMTQMTECIHHSY
ncbi:hypothetical protein MPH_05856 [Macrophomina phaseolina MS6]|uniref:Uncharacterized protein n=1 Tax=Macrophomina phaseolina (strain MS6) TaxID=1126212 RepID=K2SJ67_MACPH|nr:hypothetical protein MPH_05856 [Macrophomina phaseolina MS6]